MDSGAKFPSKKEKQEYQRRQDKKSHYSVYFSRIISRIFWLRKIS